MEYERVTTGRLTTLDMVKSTSWRKPLVPSLARATFSALLTAALVFLIWPFATPSVRTTRAQAAESVSMSCQRSLTLVLRPGAVPPVNADWNKPTARDIPPGPVIERFPLYPGAIPASVAMPPHAVIGILPSYRKVARAEMEAHVWFSWEEFWTG